MKKTVHIEGMSCRHCAKRVEDALKSAKNVISAEVNLKKNIAVVNFSEEMSDTQIKELIEAEGYNVTAID